MEMGSVESLLVHQGVVESLESRKISFREERERGRRQRERVEEMKGGVSIKLLTGHKYKIVNELTKHT